MAMHRQHRHRRARLRTNIEKRAGDFALYGVQALVLFVLCALPMVLGGRSVLSFGLAGIILLLALVLWVLSVVLRGQVRFATCHGLVLFGLIVAVGVLQLSPDFTAFFTQLSPENFSQKIWSEAATFLDSATTPLIALAPAVHMEKLLFVGLAAMLYILLCQCFSTEKSLLFLAFVVFFITTTYALLGLARYFSHDPYFLWVYLGKSAAVSGPFVSRNNFAFMQELGVLLGMGLTMLLAHSNEKSLVSQVFGNAKLYVLIATIFCVVISLLSLLLSYSRGGILGAFIGLTLFAIYCFVRRARSRSSLVFLSIFVVTLFLASSYGIDQLITRFDSMLTGEDSSSLMRLEIWKVGLNLIAMSPLLGFGFGAFRYLSPMFDDAWQGNTVAFNIHNDFIELPFSVGIPCTALVFAFFAYFFGRTAYRILTYRSSRHGHSSQDADALTPWTYLGMGCLCGIVAIACHEFVDYGLQQPANLMLTTVVAVIAGHVARMLYEQENGACPTWKLGRALYVAPVLFTGLAVIISIPYAQSVRVGLSMEKIRHLKYVPEITRNMSPKAVQDSIKRHSQQALMLAPEVKSTLNPLNLFMYPERPEALLDYAKSQYNLGRLKLQECYGKKITEQLGRNVSGERVWLAQYTSMRKDALAALTLHEREIISAHYVQSSLAYQRLLHLAPSDGVALSGLALAVYSGAPWSKNPSYERAKAYSYIGKATSMYSHIESVHDVALYLYERALRDDSLYINGKRSALYTHIAKEYMQSANVILQTKIHKLDEILPVVWSINQDLETLEELIPQTIAANESLYKFWRSIAYWYGAERALLRMQELNNARNDIENPETMGNMSFLRREKRSKKRIELCIAQYFIPIYENLHDEEKIIATKKHIRILQHVQNKSSIVKIDELMQRGEYLLAEEKIKKLPNDVSALLRYAQIAYVGGRMELFKRLMAKIEHEQDLFNAQENELYQDLYRFLQ